MNKQIKITLTEENYNRLKESAEKNYRTISQEINYRLNQLLSRPGGLDTPTTSPIYYPPGVREPGIPSPVYRPHDLNDLKDAPGIPKTPYKVTCDEKQKALSFTINQKNKDRG